MRSIEHLRNAHAAVRRVIAESERMAASFPDRRPAAEDRILEAEQELAVLEAAIEALHAGRDIDPRIARSRFAQHWEGIQAAREAIRRAKERERERELMLLGQHRQRDPSIGRMRWRGERGSDRAGFPARTTDAVDGR